MASDYHVKVEYINDQLIIEENQENLALTPDTLPIHSVVWVFEGIDDLVAAGYHPGLEFEGPSSVTETGTKLYSGPFVTLCRTSNTVIAGGNHGIASIYSYHAILEEPNSGSVIRSQKPGSIDNQISTARPATVQVRFVSEHERLRVEPEDVSLVNGQSILWEIDEPAIQVADWYPRLAFEEGNPYFGPFTSVETRDKTILGTGNGDEPGQYNYRVQMVSVENGQVLFESSPDPEIDDQGDPSGDSPDLQE